jgi:hypothetical protein
MNKPSGYFYESDERHHKGFPFNILTKLEREPDQWPESLNQALVMTEILDY